MAKKSKIITFAPQKKIESYNPTATQNKVNNTVHDKIFPSTITTAAQQKKIEYPSVITTAAPQKKLDYKEPTLQGSNNNKSPIVYPKATTTAQGSNDNKSKITYPTQAVASPQPTKVAPVITPATPIKAQTVDTAPTTNKQYVDNKKVDVQNETTVKMPNRNEFNQTAPQLEAEYTDNTELIKSLYSEDKRKQLVAEYDKQQSLIEQEAKLQEEKNIRDTEQNIRQTYATTNQTMRDLAQIKANLGGASVNDPTYKQGLITINTNLTNLIAQSNNQLMQMNSLLSIEKQKAMAENNQKKLKALNDFDTAMVTMFIQETSRIDGIRNSINEKNADLAMAQQQLNQNSYQFAATLAQQEKERQDANRWKQVANEQWNKEYQFNIQKFNEEQSARLQQLNLTKQQINIASQQWAISESNKVLQANAELKYKYDVLTASANGSQGGTRYVDTLINDLSKNVVNNTAYTMIGTQSSTALRALDDAYNSGKLTKSEYNEAMQRLGLYE